MRTIITHSAEETQKVAKEVLNALGDRNIIALYGDLGGGKTTFSQGVGRALGITQKMISPTFVMVREYGLREIHRKTPFTTLDHIDLYRIDSPGEIVGLGILDFVKDPKRLLLIEWAEKMGEYLPEKRVDVKFEYIGEGERKIVITYC